MTIKNISESAVMTCGSEANFTGKLQSKVTCSSFRIRFLYVSVTLQFLIHRCQVSCRSIYSTTTMLNLVLANGDN